VASDQGMQCSKNSLHSEAVSSTCSAQQGSQPLAPSLTDRQPLPLCLPAGWLTGIQPQLTDKAFLTDLDQRFEMGQRLAARGAGGRVHLRLQLLSKVRAWCSGSLMPCDHELLA
jgi:hypothetical protein